MAKADDVVCSDIRINPHRKKNCCCRAVVGQILWGGWVVQRSRLGTVNHRTNLEFLKLSEVNWASSILVLLVRASIPTPYILVETTRYDTPSDLIVGGGVLESWAQKLYVPISSLHRLFNVQKVRHKYFSPVTSRSRSSDRSPASEIIEACSSLLPWHLFLTTLFWATSLSKNLIVFFFEIQTTSIQTMPGPSFKIPPSPLSTAITVLSLASCFGVTLAVLVTCYGDEKKGGCHPIIFVFCIQFVASIIVIEPLQFSSSPSSLLKAHQDACSHGELSIETIIVSDENERTSQHQVTISRPSHQNHCCCICLDTIQGGDIISRSIVCRHAFHKDCLDGWVRKNPSCPSCRRSLERFPTAHKEQASSSSDDKPGSLSIFSNVFFALES